MRSGSVQFNFDMANLLKAGPAPLGVAVVLAVLLRLAGISLGILGSIIFTLFWAFCGVWYARAAIQSGARLFVTDLALNGAILGLVASVVYSLVYWIAAALRSNGYTLDVVGLLFGAVADGIIAALGAAAWYAYTTEKR
jgi:hypothetical protein